METSRMPHPVVAGLALAVAFVALVGIGVMSTVWMVMLGYPGVGLMVAAQAIVVTGFVVLLRRWAFRSR